MFEFVAPTLSFSYLEAFQRLFTAARFNNADVWTAWLGLTQEAGNSSHCLCHVMLPFNFKRQRIQLSALSQGHCWSHIAVFCSTQVAKHCKQTNSAWCRVRIQQERKTSQIVTFGLSIKESFQSAALVVSSSTPCCNFGQALTLASRLSSAKETSWMNAVLTESSKA